MSVAVPVLPPYRSLLSDEQQLYRFLLSVQAKLTADQTKILSFSQEISLLDPLQILALANAQERIHFYSENPHRQEIIFAYGVADFLSITEANRFEIARQFSQACFHNIVRIPSPVSDNFAPLVFCGFSFLATVPEPSPFPVGLVVLPQWQIVRRIDSCVLLCNIIVHKNTNLKFIIKQVVQQLKQLKNWSRHVTPFMPPRPLAPSLQATSVNSPQHLRSAMEAVLQDIRRQQLHKVVLAQALDVETEQPFQVSRCLQNLRKNYGDCHLFSLGNGQGQSFVGASPERLFSIRQHQLVTDALAGSAARGRTPAEEESLTQHLLHNPKERREHQAVLEFILQRLTEAGLSPCCAPLQLLKLSNIQHLWTPIQAPWPAHLHPLDLLAKLHPTPAVAGVPSAQACAAIRHHENFDRSLYAAPLGWIDSDGNSEFIVGIRSALLGKYQARLFAGAGIVAGSDPDREMAEIELKLQVLWRALTEA
ncbi:isochorismate synthase [Synechocystis sp. LKSZ1]|uniref:isochorismate synthase n=1 Tax=Synechocystis sp. LKSZ1 TaxID=3144951 RepID=UPI00336BC5B6